MAESGQGYPHPKIIDKPELKSPSRYVIEAYLILALLTLLIYWLLPVMSLLISILDIHLFRFEMFVQSGLKKFVLTLKNEGLIVLFLSLNPPPPIIDKPEFKSPLRYLFEGSFTLALWALWVYWILPIFTLLIWIAGIQLFRYEIFIKGGLEELINILKNGGRIVLFITLIMLGWTYYNYLWFLRRGERRNKSELITFDKDIAQFFNVDVDLLKQLKKQNRIEVKLENGQIVLPLAQQSLNNV
jgi:poly-beta-1,6-N-acetyl-D-glucosamine biosynthesis protein PgaD